MSEGHIFYVAMGENEIDSFAQFNTRAEADNLAVELAQENLGQRFVVFQAVASFKTGKPEIVSQEFKKHKPDEPYEIPMVSRSSANKDDLDEIFKDGDDIPF